MVINRQLEWLEISLVYDKRYQRKTIYDSFQMLASKLKVKYQAKSQSVSNKLQYN